MDTLELTKPITLLLIEDNIHDARLFHETLKEHPSEQYQITHVQTLGTALTALETHQFDEIVTDLNLPDSSGLSTFLNIYNQAKDTPIVILSGSVDEDIAMQTIQHGAQDYLIKEVYNDTQVIRTLKYAKERFHRTCTNKNKSFDKKLSKMKITNRETDILKSIALGKTNKEISNELGISQSTVRNHISHIFNKLGITNRTEAARLLLSGE